MTPEDLRRLADMIAAGQFVSTDPRASFFARGQQGVQFSAVRELPQLPAGADPASAAAWVNMLKVNMSEGAPRTWHVRASIGPDLVSGRVVNSPGLRIRVRWAIGQLNDETDVDLRAQASCFPITADSIEILAQNNAGLFPDSRFKCQVAVSPYPGLSDFRTPTRSLALVVNDPPANAFVDIPRHAQQVTIIAPPGPVGGVQFDVNDSGGAVLAQGVVSAFPIDIPGGANRLTITTPPVPGGSGTMGFVFRLGL